MSSSFHYYKKTKMYYLMFTIVMVCLIHLLPIYCIISKCSFYELMCQVLKQFLFTLIILCSFVITKYLCETNLKKVTKRAADKKRQSKCSNRKEPENKKRFSLKYEGMFSGQKMLETNLFTRKIYLFESNRCHDLVNKEIWLEKQKSTDNRSKIF